MGIGFSAKDWDDLAKEELMAETTKPEVKNEENKEVK